MSKKINKVILIKLFFVLSIFFSVALTPDEKIKAELIKAGIGAITVFIIEGTKAKIDEKKKE